MYRRMEQIKAINWLLIKTLTESLYVLSLLPLLSVPPHPQVLAVVIIQVERMKGIRSSFLLFLFWALLVLCSFVPLKVDIEQIIDQVSIYLDFVVYVDYCITSYPRNCGRQMKVKWTHLLFLSIYWHLQPVFSVDFFLLYVCHVFWFWCFQCGCQPQVLFISFMRLLLIGFSPSCRISQLLCRDRCLHLTFPGSCVCMCVSVCLFWCNC